MNKWNSLTLQLFRINKTFTAVPGSLDLLNAGLATCLRHCYWQTHWGRLPERGMNPFPVEQKRLNKVMRIQSRNRRLNLNMFKQGEFILSCFNITNRSLESENVDIYDWSGLFYNNANGISCCTFSLSRHVSSMRWNATDSRFVSRIFLNTHFLFARPVHTWIHQKLLASNLCITIYHITCMKYDTTYNACNVTHTLNVVSAMGVKRCEREMKVRHCEWYHCDTSCTLRR